MPVDDVDLAVDKDQPYGAMMIIILFLFLFYFILYFIITVAAVTCSI